MSNKNKKPSAVWIGPNHATQDTENPGRERGQFDTHEKGPLQRGPYVHIEWLIEEVGKRAYQKIGDNMLKNPRYDYIALKELAKELNKQ